MASNGNLQDWIISQYNSDGDLRLDFTNYAALQGSQGVLINSTASDITVAGTLVPAGKIIYNGETSDIYEIYNAVSNADDILVRGTSGDEWVDLSKTSFDTAEFEWSAGNDYYVPSEQGTGVFTPWNFSASDSVDGSQGLTVDNSSGSLDVTSHQGVFLAEDIGKFYDTQFSDVFLGSEADDAFKLGQGGTDVVTGNGGSDRFRVSSRNQNNSDFSGYSATIADYETLEEISLEDFGFDGTNWEDEYSVAFYSNLDETHISISTQTYDVASVVKIRGEYGLYNSKIEADGDVELYFVAAELLAGVVIDGTDADDKLYGYSGDDTINGLKGDDWLYGGAGNDVIDGGVGFDRIDFRESTSSVVVDFSAGTAAGAAIGSDKISNIERVIGSNFDDTLTGSTTDDDVWESFTGGLGDDIIDGAGGNDYVWYGRSDAGIQVDLETGTVTGGEGQDQLTSIEWVAGSNFADILLGSEGDDGFSPDALGDDGAGSNFKVGGADIIDGRGGVDTVSYNNTGSGGGFSPSGIVASLKVGEVTDQAGNVDKLSNIENITGSAYNDNIVGDTNANSLNGESGDDVLIGGAGDDTLDGGDGDDEIFGGAGDDTINDGAGTDIINGGDGTDTLLRNLSDDYSDYAFTPIIDLNSGKFYAEEYPDDYDTLISIENLQVAGNFNYTLKGDNADNILTAGAGDDTLFGGAGNDTLDGGAGDDFLNGGSGNDTLSLSADGVYSYKNKAQNATSEFQVGTGELVRLKGKKKISDVIDGGAEVDTVELTDSSDAFFLHDSLSGFHSSLTLVEDYDGRLGTARISNIENINSGLGDDIVDLTSPDYSLVGQNITVDGGSGDDTLWGSDANETLKGGVGDDELFGGAGTNVLTGGAGADEFQFTKTSIADTVTDYDLTSGDQLNFFYETGSEEADWSFSILNGDLRWGANTIDFGAMEVNTLGELSIFVEEIGSGQASQLEYVPTLGEEILRLDLYPALYEQDYYGKIVTDLKFTELDDLATTIDIDMTFLGELNEVAMATGIEANGNGFIYSAGAVFNNTYNTVEIVADISNFKIDGIAANPISLQALLEATTIAPDKVGGLFNSITLSANSVDYLTLNHTANGLSLIYDNATNGMINELRLDGSFTNDLNKVIPVVSDLLNFDFSDPIALLGSQEFLDTSAYLDSSATLSGLSILQKGVANPYLQLTATDTTLNVAYKDWDIVGAIEVSETWQADPDAVLSTLQNLVTSTNELDLSELGSLYEGAGSLSLAIMHDQTGKLAEGVIHDFGDLIGSLDREAGDEFIFGKATGGSYAIDSNGLAAVVFKERELNEIQITELLDELDIRLEGEGGSSSTTTVSAAALAITLEGAGLQSDYLGNDILIIG
jgi:Ca2+-binding RTX toxin-like protein